MGAALNYIQVKVETAKCVVNIGNNIENVNCVVYLHQVNKNKKSIWY